MTVIFSKKCELGLQAVLFLSTLESDKNVTAAEIAEELEIPKEFVAKILQFLTDSNIVGSKKGKNGGFFLSKQTEDIKLIDIVEAIDGLDAFNKCVLGFKNCSVDEPCPVHDKWGNLREDAIKMLSEENLAELRDKTIQKISSLINKKGAV
jgi:Rrf2 family protein